ncbi:MAG: hypothetical protein ACLSHU_07290 [Oscillospiraceae bacterium]
MYNNLGNVAENVKHCFCRCRLFAKERGLQQCPGFSVRPEGEPDEGLGYFVSRLAVSSFWCYTLHAPEERFAGECCEIAKRRAFYQPDAAPPHFPTGD